MILFSSTVFFHGFVKSTLFLKRYIIKDIKINDSALSGIVRNFLNDDFSANTYE